MREVIIMTFLFSEKWNVSTTQTLDAFYKKVEMEKRRKKKVIEYNKDFPRERE